MITDIPLDSITLPPAWLFAHPSELHGPRHVRRVMIHAVNLMEATGTLVDYGPRLWAAVYLHDLRRTHDGVCHRHGSDAMRWFYGDPDASTRCLFASGGVRQRDWPEIHTAVVWHCVMRELPRDHPHYTLTALLKDADGLDRVRLGDLDPTRLRFAESRRMIDFAEDLYAEDQILFGAAGGSRPQGVIRP